MLRIIILFHHQNRNVYCKILDNNLSGVRTRGHPPWLCHCFKYTYFTTTDIILWYFYQINVLFLWMISIVPFDGGAQSISECSFFVSLHIDCYDLGTSHKFIKKEDHIWFCFIAPPLLC